MFDQRGEMPLLPFGNPIGFVPASRGGVYIESKRFEFWPQEALQNSEARRATQPFWLLCSELLPSYGSKPCSSKGVGDYLISSFILASTDLGVSSNSWTILVT
ncbi:MAG: hypothetical protein V3R83_05855, partial [Gammaproteobacteria bacterium]